MSVALGLDLSRLGELRDRFDRAACNHPNVDAVVVYRPDLRREEVEREGRSLLIEPSDAEIEISAAERIEQRKRAHAARLLALATEYWIPPSDKSIEQLGGQEYWCREIRASEYPEICGLPANSLIWHCSVFGPRARDIEDTARRLFNMLAEDAASLILPKSKAVGKALLSRWLIHLVDQPDPIGRRRQFLHWSTFGGRLSPMWVPVTPQNPPTCWWAARLYNVFQISRDVIDHQLDLGTRWAASAASSLQPTETVHPDGLEGGRWLWWNGKRFDVPIGTIYRLLDYMWKRDFASYDSLNAEVFDSPVKPQTVRSYANKANNALPQGSLWRLSANSNNRQLTKVLRSENA
jgi:hypothetical protein